MTANELADELHKLFVGEEYDRLVHEIPDLLRQQAQEIEALKKSFDVLRSAYISVSGGLEVSLELNKAQALRNGGEK